MKLVHGDEAPPLFEFDEPLLDEPLLSEFDEPLLDEPLLSEFDEPLLDEPLSSEFDDDDPPLSVDGGLLSLDGGCCD